MRDRRLLARKKNILRIIKTHHNGPSVKVIRNRGDDLIITGFKGQRE